MIKKFFSQNLDFIYYLLRSVDSKKKFIIISPNFISYFFKKTLIFDKKKKKFFSVFIENFYDYDSIIEIFGLESYNITNSDLFKKMIQKYENDFKKNLIIDCGANIGCSALYFDKSINNTKIVCIEPDNKNFDILKKNLNRSNFDLINSAVGSSKIKYTLIDDENKRAIKIEEQINSDKETLTINEILNDYNEDHFINLLIKIDIEGFEKNLFAKNYSWLFKFDVIIIEIHDYLFPSEAVSDNFFRLIYKINQNIKYSCILQGENLIFFKL